MGPAEISDTIDVNLLGPIFVAQQAFPYLKRSRGQLLFFTSSSYTRGRAGYSLYSRSEEHTSELQSRQYLVCRLLLEKKKKKYTILIYSFYFFISVSSLLFIFYFRSSILLSNHFVLHLLY